MNHLEIAVSNMEAALLAEKVGVHRIELCDNLGEGGTTPSIGAIKYAIENIQIPVYPIIRPRGGDFLYSSIEMNVIKNDVAICNDMGCKGIVIGMLCKDGTIDIQNLKAVLKVSGEMKITFHRAFDRCKNVTIALEILIDHGISTVLTSGQKPNALAGANTIKELIVQANNRITIMPGAGVRASNLMDIMQQTGATFYHTSAGIMAESNMQYFNKSIDSNAPMYLHTNETEITNMLKILNA
jgi:copper homeostasis protein